MRFLTEFEIGITVLQSKVSSAPAPNAYLALKCIFCVVAVCTTAAGCSIILGFLNINI